MPEKQNFTTRHSLSQKTCLFIPETLFNSLSLWDSLSFFEPQWLMTCQWWTFMSVCNQPPRPTQPSIPPGSVNEDQLRLGRQRQVYGSFRYRMNAGCAALQVNLWDPLRSRAIPEREVLYKSTFTLPYLSLSIKRNKIGRMLHARGPACVEATCCPVDSWSTAQS